MNGGGTLQFSNRLAHASPTEVARTQISADEGTTWTDLDAQTGSGGVGQVTFAPKTLSLAAYVGQIIKIRFLYDIGNGSFTIGDSADYGWFIDQIGFSNVDELTSPVITDVNAGSNFDFVPEIAANYTLEIRARLQNRVLPWGPVKNVAAIPGPPIVRISGIEALARGQLEIDFALDVGTNTVFTLVSTPVLDTPPANWTTENTASSSVGGNSFRFVFSRPQGDARYYRVIPH